MNSLPPTDTSNVQLHMDHFPLEKIWKLGELLSATKNKRATLRWEGEVETVLKEIPSLVQQHAIGVDLIGQVFLPE